MHEQEYAIVRALVPVAWVDGHFADKEHAMLEAFLEAYGASEEQKDEIRRYATERRTLDDIHLQDLSAADRRVLLQCAVLMTFADGVQQAAESELLVALASKLRIPSDEATTVIGDAEARAKKNLELLT